LKVATQRRVRGKLTLQVQHFICSLKDQRQAAFNNPLLLRETIEQPLEIFPAPQQITAASLAVRPSGET